MVPPITPTLSAGLNMVDDDGDGDEHPGGAVLDAIHGQSCRDYDAGAEQIHNNSIPTSPAAIIASSINSGQSSEFRNIDHVLVASASVPTPPVPFNFAEHEEKQDIVAMNEKIAMHISNGAKVPAPPTPSNFVEFEDDNDGAVIKQLQGLRSEAVGDVTGTIAEEEQMEDEEELNTNRGASHSGAETSIGALPRRVNDTEEGNEEAHQQIVDVDAGDAQRSQNGPDALNASSGARSTFLGRVSSILVARVSNTVEQLIMAVLVEEEEPEEVFMAAPVGYFERKWKPFACVMCFLVVTLSVFLGVYLNSDAHRKNEVEVIDHYIPATDAPSMSPSSPPSFDHRPTLEIVQERGHVRCGLLRAEAEASIEGDHSTFCRAVAAVVLGDPALIIKVPVTISNRFQLLHTRAFDLLLNDIAHTIEREFKEITTGTGFTFSSPYRYDSAYFFGNQTLVECAEERKRHSQCSSLFMCALNATTIPGILETLFPSGFFKVISEEEIGNEVGKYLTDSSKPGVCNVFPGNGGLGSSISAGINDARFVGGSKQESTEAGFAFSTPFKYGGTTYVGYEAFVHCTEEHKRYIPYFEWTV